MNFYPPIPEPSTLALCAALAACVLAGILTYRLLDRLVRR